MTKWIRLTTLFLSHILLYAQPPVARLTVGGFVNDFAYAQNRLFVATDEGSIEVFDLSTMRLTDRLQLPPIKYPERDEKLPVRLLSVDVSGNRLLFVGIVKEGFRSVWLYDAQGLHQIISPRRRLMIKEARFGADGEILIATFDSRLLRYATREKGVVSERQVTDIALGDMALSADRKTLYMSDESGAVRAMRASDGRSLGKSPCLHLDSVHHVAAASGVVITGGNDRKVCVSTPRKHYTIDTGFPVYTVGLSPDGRVGVYLDGDRQYLQVFDIETGKRITTLEGHKSVVNQIRFIGPRRLVSSEKGPTLLLWELPRDADQ